MRSPCCPRAAPVPSSRSRSAAEPIERAIHEQSVTILLADEIDISRGDMIVKSAEQPRAVKQIDATVCWLSETPMSPARTYLLRHTSREVKAKIAKIDYRLDVNTLEQEAIGALAMNDIAQLTPQARPADLCRRLRQESLNRRLHHHRREHQQHGWRRHDRRLIIAIVQAPGRPPVCGLLQFRHAPSRSVRALTVHAGRPQVLEPGGDKPAPRAPSQDEIHMNSIT